MSLESEEGVVAEHAAAIVDDADKAASTGFDFHADVGRAGVERILEELLDYRSGPFHYFSGGDFVSDLVGENANAAQEVMVARLVPRGFASWLPSFVIAPAEHLGGLTAKSQQPTAWCGERIAA